ncbi:MAG: hypothetical protein ACK58T_08715 [Phycisphaerae bacterium]
MRPCVLADGFANPAPENPSRLACGCVRSFAYRPNNGCAAVELGSGLGRSRRLGGG